MPADTHSPQDPAMQYALRRVAEAAARAGGQIARRYFGTDYDVRLKADRSEVSEADEAAQTAAIELLRRERPDDAILAEEELPETHDAPRPDNERVCWVIDPIDGTRNFVRHIPVYSCSVAAMQGGSPLVGAIHHADRDVLYSASRAEGLFIDDHALPAEGRGPRRGLPHRPVVALPSSPVGRLAQISHAWLDRFVCRNLGSTALHLAYVATGQLDAILADNPRLWDVAAGWVMLMATGCSMTTPTGEPIFPLDVGAYRGQELPLIAAPTALHARLVSD